VDLQESGDILETDKEGVGGWSKGVHEYFPESEDVLKSNKEGAGAEWQSAFKFTGEWRCVTCYNWTRRV
jgi:hypothetical protein